MELSELEKSIAKITREVTQSFSSSDTKSSAYMKRKEVVPVKFTSFCVNVEGRISFYILMFIIHELVKNHVSGLGS